MLCPNWGPTSGLGPPWLVSVFGVAHGMYAAGFLGAVTRGAAEYGLQFSNYFEPVNEGAFNVFARNITVTPVGQVRQPRHHFGTFPALFFSAPPHPTRAVCYALLGAHAAWVLNCCLELLLGIRCCDPFQVMALYSQHQGRALLDLPAEVRHFPAQFPPF